ncbi:hypothetical protein F4778DRAFT_577665 [Xylariomycetidae sp. FL2044]|nr:hypothetical protein F4778DRAFT_577665 [Xylariomycetidae sp. FL2044]
MASSASLPAPRRITASNLPLDRVEHDAEPAVEVMVDVLEQEPILGGALVRSRVATAPQVPSSNDGFGHIPLQEVPGMGIVLPGGLNFYYLDIAPKTEGAMHRTTSTDYLIVLQGTLSLLTPPKSFADGGYGEAAEELCRTGDVVIQRGILHALSNRTDEWVRVLGVVVASKANTVPLSPGRGTEVRVLDDKWLG